MQPKNVQNQAPGLPPVATPVAQPDPLSEFSIDEQLYELHHSPEWESGIARRVLIRYPIFQITLRAMKAGTGIPTTITQGESACIFWVGTSHACGWQVIRPAAKAKCWCWTGQSSPTRRNQLKKAHFC